MRPSGVPGGKIVMQNDKARHGPIVAESRSSGTGSGAALSTALFQDLRRLFAGDSSGLTPAADLDA